jgi:hypothetical protein
VVTERPYIKTQRRVGHNVVENQRTEVRTHMVQIDGRNGGELRRRRAANDVTSIAREAVARRGTSRRKFRWAKDSEETIVDLLGSTDVKLIRPVPCVSPRLVELKIPRP